MGLDTSHDCFHGAYSAFMRFRQQLAKAAGIPLPLMEGFYDRPYPQSMEWIAPRDGGPACGDPLGPLLHRWAETVDGALPLRWDLFEADPLTILLNHSDCDGDIAAEDCAPLADRLAELKPSMPTGGHGHLPDPQAATQQFIDGLRLAASNGEAVEFH